VAGRKWLADWKMFNEWYSRMLTADKLRGENTGWQESGQATLCWIADLWFISHFPKLLNDIGFIQENEISSGNNQHLIQEYLFYKPGSY
jgi:hypothetical protein